MPDTPDLIPAAEVARILGVHRSTVSRMVSAGTLTVALRGNGHTGPMFFRRSDVEALLKGQAA